MTEKTDSKAFKALDSHDPASEKIEDLADHDNELTTIPSNAEGHVSYGKSGIAGLIESPYVLGAAFLASMGGFSFGYDQGVISIVNVMQQFHAAFPQAETAFGKGFMTGMLEFGAFIGCFFMPTLADMISRKRALTVVVVIFNIGAIMQTAAQSYGVLVAGRTIGGIGVGTLAMGAPIYISEIAPPNLRGTLLVLESISIVTGVVSSFWITYGTRHLPGEASFRVPFGLQMVCSTVLGLGIHLYPYSPRWLALVDRPDAALQSLSALRRLPASDVRVQMEHKDILSEVEIEKLVREKRHPGAKRLKLEVLGWLDLFRKRTWRRTAVGVGVAFFQQFSGINAFIYYAPTLFQSLGQSEEMSLVMSGVFNVLQLVAVAACFVVIDKVGRRPLAIVGGLGGGVAWTVMAVLTGLFDKDWLANPAAGWAAVAMAFVFILVYGVSYSPLGWCLPAEVFPNASRSKGVALSTATVWLCNFIVGVSTPPMLEDLGFGTYVFFGAWCYIAAVWAYFLVPETKGKTLEQMDEVFGDYAAQEEKEIMRAQMAQPRRSVVAEV
ncbi:High-affinity glucose transporter [Diplodia seriata]|uniref:High-affinity glucose transporter n=1 Tax=Diplodia seriata TaxID=420778 RepID=A0A1S8B9W4_9PEZI|nr:High-affinity glucose transporter [Diplodia seriata]